jgi:hypothetical protein
MTQDADSKIVHRTGNSKNMKQHAVRCQYIDIMVNSHQLLYDLQWVYVENYTTRELLPI